MKIIDLNALQILDSRGNPTIQVSTTLEDGSKGTFKVPSGASTGIHEAHELRDNNKNSYGGKSVLSAIENIEKIKDEILDRDFNQFTLDETLIALDGTENKELLGANTILGVSISFAKASAKFYSLPLYEYLYRINNNINLKNTTYMKKSETNLFANIINGGLHSGNELMIQEFMIIPTLSEDMESKIRCISEIYQKLKEIISKKYGSQSTAVGDEGGFAPNISKPKEALDLIMDAIIASNYEGEVSIALDAAASDFYDKESKLYEVEKGLKLDYKKLTDYYVELINSYPIISIEDAMDEDDFQGFNYYLTKTKDLGDTNYLTKKIGILSVGDDLLVTNPKRIKMAFEKNLCNSLLLKINQIGSLSESLEAARMAKEKSWHVIVSHRSGETTDDFIADLAVALNSSIKLGAPARGERVSKYNRLLNIYNN